MHLYPKDTPWILAIPLLQDSHIQLPPQRYIHTKDTKGTLGYWLVVECSTVNRVVGSNLGSSRFSPNLQPDKKKTFSEGCEFNPRYKPFSPNLQPDKKSLSSPLLRNTARNTPTSHIPTKTTPPPHYSTHKHKNPPSPMDLKYASTPEVVK